ncbi:MAG: GNAT family N-acetyltransferase [Ilumatobacteraceae bacterium]
MTDAQPNISILAPRHLDQVLALNNVNTPAVGVLTAGELEFLVQHSLHALIATDVGGNDVHAFCLTFAPGVPYTSPNYRWFSDRYDNFVYLDRIAVESGYQNRGCGAALYDAVERHMISDRTASLLTCEVNLQPPNPGSLRFHQRLGFSEVGQQESKPGLIVSMLAKHIPL